MANKILDEKGYVNFYDEKGTEIKLFITGLRYSWENEKLYSIKGQRKWEINPDLPIAEVNITWHDYTEDPKTGTDNRTEINCYITIPEENPVTGYSWQVKNSTHPEFTEFSTNQSYVDAFLEYGENRFRLICKHWNGSEVISNILEYNRQQEEN